MKKGEAFIAALVEPMQALEDAFQQLRVGLRLGTAVGAQLDLIGKLVGLPRGGLDDETYERYLAAQIAAHKSDGVIEDIITVSRLVIDDDDATHKIDAIGTAAYHLIVEDVVVDVEVARVLVALVRKATLDGVRAIVETWPAPEGEMFAFEEFPGETGTGAGFGSTLDPDVGGVLANGMT